MTKVTIFKQQGLYKGFEVSGHSGYADAGEDIVCAAISALTINCINLLMMNFYWIQMKKQG